MCTPFKCVLSLDVIWPPGTGIPTSRFTRCPFYFPRGSCKVRWLFSCHFPGRNGHGPEEKGRGRRVEACLRSMRLQSCLLCGERKKSRRLLGTATATSTTSTQYQRVYQLGHTIVPRLSAGPRQNPMRMQYKRALYEMNLSVSGCRSPAPSSRTCTASLGGM